MAYLLIKYLHILGAIVILGTGAGIAFFMVMAHRSGDVAFIAKTASVVVLADYIFTATAVAAQPVTGYLLMRETGVAWGDHWILAALGLYAVAGAFWLPVVWMQKRMRDIASDAAAAGVSLPANYYRLFRLWFVFGFPGFAAVLAIIWIMIGKSGW